MEALQDEENELYVQSPAYLYELMKGRWQRLRGIVTAPVGFDYKQDLANRYEACENLPSETKCVLEEWRKTTQKK